MIEIRRGGGWVDALRSWKVIIDGTERGRVRRNSVQTFEVDVGPHRVEMKIAWCGSNQVIIDLAEGHQVVLACQPAMRSGLHAVASSFLAPDQRIRLEVV